MNKKYVYKDGVLLVEYPFNEEYLRTLFVIKANEGYVAFKNRDPMSDEDLDGNEISWGICDDLVEMGLLEEDEESYEVAYEMTDDGESVIEVISANV